MPKLTIPHSANFAYLTAWRRGIGSVHSKEYSTTIRRFAEDTFQVAIVSDSWKATQSAANLTPDPRASGRARLHWTRGAALELVAPLQGSRVLSDARLLQGNHLLSSAAGQCFGVSGSAWILRFRMQGGE